MIINMSKEFLEPIHCHKCKKKTENFKPIKVQTTNGLWRISTQCLKCKTNKSKFIKTPSVSIAFPKTKLEKISEQDELSIAKELHKPVRSRFPRRRIKTYSIDDLWAADLVIMRNFINDNSGYSYMLNVIDTFSKFAWSQPLKKKDGKNVTKAFEEILKRAKLQKHNSPKLLHTDKGTEFVNKKFKEMLEKYDIKLYHTQNEEKSAIIERFNRTLNGKMRIRFEIQKNKRWIDILQDLLKEYNFKDIHRTIRMIPFEVNKSNEEKVLLNLFPNKVSKSKIKLEISDRVRIKKLRKTFDNKFNSNWTREIFIVTEILNTNPITYKIKDLNNENIEGSFYNEELQKTKF